MNPTRNQKPQIDSIVFTPAGASVLAIKAVERLRQDHGGGIPSGIADMDRILLPARPGELISIIGYTSHYKSGFLDWLGMQAIESIKEKNDIIVKATWEQSVEEDTLAWMASKSGISITRMVRGDIGEPEWNILMQASYERAVTPLWVVGHSQQESGERRRARPRMTMTDMARALEYILNEATDRRLQIRAIILDYLQRIKPDRQDGHNRREQMMEIVNRAKDAAVSFGCPVFLGVQSRRDVNDRSDKIPRIDDGQECSAIEQTSDKVVSLWYPIKTEKLYTEIQLVSKVPPLRVTKNLLIARLLKQKFGGAPATFALYVDPEQRIIGSMEKL